MSEVNVNSNDPIACCDIHVHLSRIDVAEVSEQNMCHFQLTVGIPLPFKQSDGSPLDANFARIHTGLDKSSAINLANELLEIANNLQEQQTSNIQVATSLDGVDEAKKAMDQFK